MIFLASALIVAGALMWAASRTLDELRQSRRDAARERALQILATFAPAAGAASADPRAVLVWEPLARAARRLCPDEFAELDRAADGSFPIGRERIQAAHAKWTADWLAWERSHDGEYKLKAATVEEEMARTGHTALLRARLDAVEREKLDLYQRKYEEYVRVGKALQALT